MLHWPSDRMIRCQAGVGKRGSATWTYRKQETRGHLFTSLPSSIQQEHRPSVVCCGSRMMIQSLWHSFFQFWCFKGLFPLRLRDDDMAKKKKKKNSFFSFRNFFHCPILPPVCLVPLQCKIKVARHADMVTYAVISALGRPGQKKA